MNPVVIKRARVSVAAQHPSPPVRSRDDARPRAACAAPAVRPIEEDGLVVALEVTCACGEATVVELAYREARP